MTVAVVARCETSLGLLARCGRRRRSASSASVTCSQANPSSRGSSLRSPSTARPARRASGTPATSRRRPRRRRGSPAARGSRLAVVASRLVHASSIASRPSIGGIAGSVPPARKTALRASSSSSPDRAPAARRRAARGRARARCPRPRATAAATESSRSWMISSRRASTACTSSSPVTASAAPGIRRASASASYGPQQRLRGHARPERALAADEAVLDDRHLEARVRRAAPPPPRRPARRRSPPRRSSASAAPVDLYNGERIPLGTTWLRRGRFAGAVASRGAGGLVKPRQHHKCG